MEQDPTWLKQKSERIDSGPMMSTVALGEWLTFLICEMRGRYQKSSEAPESR